VKTRAQVEQIVRAVKYPPWASGDDECAHQHRLPRDDDRRVRRQDQPGDHGDRPDRDREAVEDIDAILAVPGVDAALMVGGSVRLAGRDGHRHAKVTEYIQRVQTPPSAAGYPRHPCGDLETLKIWRDRGCAC